MTTDRRRIAMSDDFVQIFLDCEHIVERRLANRRAKESDGETETFMDRLMRSDPIPFDQIKPRDRRRHHGLAR